MRYHHLGPGHAVLEIDYTPGRLPTAPAAKGEPPPLDLELVLWYGGGEPTRAAWLWSQSGRVAWWAVVGQA